MFSFTDNRPRFFGPGFKGKWLSFWHCLFHMHQQGWARIEGRKNYVCWQCKGRDND